MKQLTLADLIAALQSAVDNAGSLANPDIVRIEWCLMRPGKWASYRGDYSQIALAFAMHGDDEVADVDIVTFLRECRNMIGAVVVGYKGGNYVVSERAPLWVANHGQCTGVAITGFKQFAGYFLLETAVID